MKITKGYVAVAPDGSFYRKAEYQTHVGTRVELKQVVDIEEATVFHGPAFDDYRLRHEPGHKVLAWAEVEVKRFVELKSYGVKKGQ